MHQIFMLTHTYLSKFSGEDTDSALVTDLKTRSFEKTILFSRTNDFLFVSKVRRYG